MRSSNPALAFAAAAVVSALILGSVLHGLGATSALASVLTGTLAAGLSLRRPGAAAGLKFWDWTMILVFALASARAFLWLAHFHGDELVVLSPNNLGDLSLHLHLIRYLAGGVALWPESPILAGVPLTYPIGSDLFNALFEVLGADTIRALIWTGLAGAALTGMTLWRWGGAFGIAALLFNGGLAGFAFFKSGVLEDFQAELVWKNLFLSMFVTQRGLLFALPAGLLLLSEWRDRFFRGAPRGVPAWLEVLLYAVMPIFSLHTFLFLTVIIVAVSAGQKAARVALARLVALAFVPATLLVLCVTGGFSVVSGLRWLPGWITAGGNWTGWLWNFGLSLPLLIITGLLLIRERDVEARCFVWPSLLLFGLCCLIAFAPWEWDNMKLMMWSWLAVAPYVWSKVIARVRGPARHAVVIVLFASGALSLAAGLDSRHGSPIARRSEIDAWRGAIADLPMEDRFACMPAYNHPLVYLGRKLACGYEGHLWSHGLPFREKLSLLEETLAGRMEWKATARILETRWLALRTIDSAAEASGYPAVPVDSVGTLYDLRSER